MIDMISAFILAWVSTLSGVALGGWLVYRTKREGYDNMFSMPPAGEAFNVEDPLSDMPLNVSKASIPKPIKTANDVFVDQFVQDIAGKR
jgi:hypothetical protein